MNTWSRSVTLAGAIFIGGCTALPSFDNASITASDPRTTIEPIPTATDVINHVQCVLYGLLSDSDANFEKIQADRYIVFANLTLEVTEDGSLDPSLSFIHPLSVVDTSKLFGVTGKYGAAAHRTYQHEFTLSLDKTERGMTMYQQVCANAAAPGRALSGDLGIRSVVAQGLKKIKPDDFIFPLVVTSDPTSGLLNWPIVPTFGSTIDFSLTYGVGLNAKWTLVHFEGPGTDSGLFNVSRTTKDTLVIAFAPSQAPKVGKPDSSAPALADRDAAAARAARAAQDAAAARAAQDAVTRMFLRQFPFR